MACRSPGCSCVGWALILSSGSIATVAPQMRGGSCGTPLMATLWPSSRKAPSRYAQATEIPCRCLYHRDSRRTVRSCPRRCAERVWRCRRAGACLTPGRIEVRILDPIDPPQAGTPKTPRSSFAISREPCNPGRAQVSPTPHVPTILPSNLTYRACEICRGEQTLTDSVRPRQTRCRRWPATPAVASSRRPGRARRVARAWKARTALT